MHSLDERYFRTDAAEQGHRVYSFLTCRLAHSIPFSARSELMGYRLRCDRTLHEPSQHPFATEDRSPEALRKIIPVPAPEKSSGMQELHSGAAGAPGRQSGSAGTPGLNPFPAERTEAFAAQLFRFWDTILDTSPGPAWLAHPAVAEFTQVSLHAMEGILCRLEGYAIMPTHVHVLYSQQLELNRGPAPMHVADALKTPVAHFASRVLDLRGAFWQKEDYHRILRSAREVESVQRYIQRDPVRAGLVSKPEKWLWKWERTG